MYIHKVYGVDMGWLLRGHHPKGTTIFPMMLVTTSFFNKQTWNQSLWLWECWIMRKSIDLLNDMFDAFSRSPKRYGKKVSAFQDSKSQMINPNLAKFTMKFLWSSTCRPLKSIRWYSLDKNLPFPTMQQRVTVFPPWVAKVPYLDVPGRKWMDQRFGSVDEESPQYTRYIGRL